MRRPVLLAAAVAFALVGCGKKSAKNKTPDSSPSPDTTAGGSGGGGSSNSGGISAAGGVGIVFNPAAALGGGGSGGAVQAVRKAARRTQALNEMSTLGQVIEQMRDPTGRMPTKDQIVAELKQYPKLLEGVTEGAYVLTGTTEGGGLWAYEVDADKTPGIALIGGRATRSTPDELRPYFAQMPPQHPAQPPARPPQQPRQQNRPDSSAAPTPAPGAAVTMKDMEDIRLFIDNVSASGRMPDVQTTYGALVQSGSPAAKLVQSRAIILTGTQSRESVWADEAKAATQGGMIAGPNGVETVTAVELVRRAGQR